MLWCMSECDQSLGRLEQTFHNSADIDMYFSKLNWCDTIVQEEVDGNSIALDFF